MSEGRVEGVTMGGEATSACVEEYVEQREAILDWEVGIVSYKLGERYYCKIDNVSPGAAIARGEGTTREQARAQALAQAKDRLSRTRQFKV